MEKLSIKQIKNGPLKIVNLTNESLKEILFYENKELLIEKCAFICRCGRSQNQPYCDGNHKKYNFDSSNETTNDIIQSYESNQITITFNRSICSGAARCVRAFPKIYKSASKDWISPENGSTEEIIQSVKNCPSGALSYEINSNKKLEEYKNETINILKKAPIVVKGKIDFEVEKWSQFANKEKFTLCRCGASKNKPFCDYAHASLEDKSYTF